MLAAQLRYMAARFDASPTYILGVVVVLPGGASGGVTFSSPGAPFLLLLVVWRAR
jgi:hypothetical protein